VSIIASGSLRPDSASIVAAVERSRRRPLAPQHREDHCGVGGRDDRPDQQRDLRGQAQEQRGAPGEGPREHHAGGGERGGGRGHAPHHRGGCVERAVEEDQHERHAADPECERVVVERDPADALRARQHAHREEDQQRRDADRPGSGLARPASRSSSPTAERMAAVARGSLTLRLA
jgi:hypothetical protein